MEVYAHRGAHCNFGGRIVENTMDAFQCALEEQDCDGIECDLRMSHDGFLLLHHDPMTRAMSQVIRDVRFRDLKAPYDIPRLEEVFLLIKKTNKQCFLELKESDRTLLEKLILMMHTMRMREQVVCIGFPEHTDALRHLATSHGFRTGIIPRSPVDAWRALREPAYCIALGWTSPKERKLFLRFAFLLPWVSRIIRRHKKEIVAGVINDHADMLMFLDCKAERFISDNTPDALAIRNSLKKF